MYRFLVLIRQFCSDFPRDSPKWTKLLSFWVFHVEGFNSVDKYVLQKIMHHNFLAVCAMPFPLSSPATTMRTNHSCRSFHWCSGILLKLSQKFVHFYKIQGTIIYNKAKTNYINLKETMKVSLWRCTFEFLAALFCR